MASVWGKWSGSAEEHANGEGWNPSPPLNRLVPARLVVALGIEEVGQPDRPAIAQHHVDFSPDGSKLASASPLGIVRIWALDLDDLIAIAKRNVTRDLTADECRQYLHDRGCG